MMGFILQWVFNILDGRSLYNVPLVRNLLMIAQESSVGGK